MISVFLCSFDLGSAYIVFYSIISYYIISKILSSLKFMITISIAVTFVPLSAVILLLPHCLPCKHKIIQNFPSHRCCYSYSTYF